MDTTQIWSNIIAYAVQVGLLVGIGAALPFLLRLRVPSARLLYWQLLLVACLALPWVRPWHLEVIAANPVSVAATRHASGEVTAALATPALPPVADIALWILAAGMAARLVWLAIGLLKLSRYRRHGRAMPMPPEWMGSAGHARLLLSDEISGPVTFGFFRPVVLLPANFPSMSNAMRDAILFHELLHIERRDWLCTLGEEIVRAAFWFHPAIWWVLGEIQLSREQTVDQAVIEMTQARDPYVDTLLAMAGVSPQMDLAPAPLFLRRRHLKQRVMGLVREVRMSKTRMILAQAAAVAAMAVACWVITGAIPLRAQAQIVADDSGVAVNLNGSQLMHRSAVTYPAAALAKGVEGTVVVQVRLDANGEVLDDTVLSGPDELRRGVQQSVLNWHFDRSAASTTRVVNIDFVKPANSGAAPAPGGMNPVARAGLQQQAVVGFFNDEVARAKRDLDNLQSQQASAGIGASADQQAETARRIQSAQSAYLDLLKKANVAEANGLRIQRFVGSTGTVTRIDVAGISDSAREQLLSQLLVHVGDAYSPEVFSRASDVVRQFDEHLTLSDSSAPSGDHVLRISTQQPQFIPAPALNQGPIPAGAQKIGGNVMAANLINPVKPIYPPLAKMARQQGTVKFQATIGKDGTIEELSVISGPPLLIQAAQDAVSQWTYKPTLLNGAPVEVVTTIDVNFSLSDGPPPAPAQ